MTASTDLHASPAPPEALPELRSLALAIARGKSIVTLGGKVAEALSSILEMGGDPVMLSTPALAENLSINPSKRRWWIGTGSHGHSDVRRATRRGDGHGLPTLCWPELRSCSMTSRHRLAGHRRENAPHARPQSPHRRPA